MMRAASTIDLVIVIVLHLTRTAASAAVVTALYVGPLSELHRET